MKKNLDFKKLLLFCLFLAPSAYGMNDSECNGFSDIFNENWEQPTEIQNIGEVEPIDTNLYLREEIRYSYANSWREIPEQQIKVFHEFHSNLAKNVVIAHSMCVADVSNAAAFGFTVYLKGSPPKIIPYQKTVVSGKINIPKKEEYEGNLIESKELITKSSESEKDSYICFLSSVHELIPELFWKHGRENKNLIEFFEENFTKIERFINDHKNYGQEMNSFLHCEQSFIIDFLKNPENELLRDLVEYLSENRENVEEISFDTITYNDMCPVCFSSYFSAYEKIREKIFSVLQHDNFGFRIAISSLRPYDISNKFMESLEGRTCTRGPNLLEDKVFVTKYAEKKVIHKTRMSDIAMTDDRIIQFINQTCVNEQVMLSLKKCYDTVKLSEGRATDRMHFQEYLTRVIEVSELLQYFLKNGMKNQITQDVFNTLKNFINSGSHVISDIQWHVKLALNSISEFENFYE